MDDYLSEKEQWEAVKRWIRENGLWIVAGVAVGAMSLGGWRLWQDHSDNQAREASEKYQQTIQAFARGDRTRGLLSLDELERDHPSSPYVDQGKLIAARIYVDAGELDKAARELQGVAQHSKDSELALIARTRLARVQIAQKKPDEALTTLSKIEPGAFAPRYYEVRGDAYYAKGDKAAALREYRMARAKDLTGDGETSRLDLKISDLAAEESSAATVKTDVARAAPAK